MICKIQVPLVTTEINAAALVYNKDRSVSYFTTVSNPLKAWMKGRPKAFFHVKYNVVKTAFEITGEAPWQDW